MIFFEYFLEISNSVLRCSVNLMLSRVRDSNGKPAAKRSVARTCSATKQKATYVAWWRLRTKFTRPEGARHKLFYRSSISKFTKSWNCCRRISMSSFVISFNRSVPNFSTQKLAIAEPMMIAVFMFSNEMSFVRAM